MISISAFRAFPQIPDLARAAGLKLEFTGLIDPLHYPSEFIEEIKGRSHFDLFHSAHGPFYDLIPPSSDAELRELAKRKFIRAIDATKSLGIKHLVLHAGWMRDFYSDEMWVSNSIAFWSDLMDSCDDDLTIHLENVFEQKPSLMRAIIEGVNRKNFRMCLDIGHVNLTTGGKMIEWIDELCDLIGHVHIHNNFGVEDDHNGLDQGNIEIHKVLEALKEKCPNANWNLEIRSNFEESIEMICQYR
jgi:sugar phosphate isomerase/epimerase